jgi:LDH2 family malate/lactate/ureidoglycolate dehydrogenase
MEQLIDETKGVEKAPGVDEIFFPGELERRAESRHLAKGIPLADNTWDSLVTLATQTGVPLPHIEKVSSE